MPQKNYEPRRKPNQKRARVTFDAILEASAQLLAEQGYAGTTTNAIAERAGVSIGSVYEYFPGKDAIFAALKARLDSETFASVLGQVKNIDGNDPEAFLRAVLESRIHVALEQPELEALLRDEIPASVFEAQSEAQFSAFDSGMRAFGARHPEAIRIKNLEAAMNLGTNVVELTVRHYAANQPEMLRDPDVVDAFVDMMVRWILKDPSDR